MFSISMLILVLKERGKTLLMKFSSYFWDRFHSYPVLPVEIFTVCETTVSKVGKITLSTYACDDSSRLFGGAVQPRPIHQKLSWIGAAVKLLLLHF